jgi:hypothetical protein
MLFVSEEEGNLSATYPMEILMKNILSIFSLYAAFLIGTVGLAVADDTPAPDSTKPGFVPPTSQPAGGTFTNSNGSLTDKNGNRIGVKGQPEPTLKKDTDKNGNQLDQNGVPIPNGLSSRGVVHPKKHVKKHTSKKVPTATPTTSN